MPEVKPARPARRQTTMILAGSLHASMTPRNPVVRTRTHNVVAGTMPLTTDQFTSPLGSPV